MVSQITADDVRNILEVPGDVSDDSLDAFANMAYIVVSEDLAGKGLSDARLTNIQKLLAAHFALAMTERGGLTSSRLGDAQDNYLTLSPMGNAQITGFQLTRYGQQAVALDSSGTLLSISKGRLSSKFSVNSEFKQQTSIIWPGY